MSTLTTILRRAGHITDEDVAQIESHRRSHGCHAYESVLKLRFVDDETLVRILSGRLMLPVAGSAVLSRVEPQTLAHVPAELAWGGRVLPVSVDDIGNLTLAMADPTDERAVHAVADHTGAYLLRAVAPVGPLHAALLRFYGDEPARGDLEPAPTPFPSQGHPSSRPADAGAGAAPDAVPGQAAAHPGAAPLSPAAFASLLPRLVAAPDRDEIIAVLLDFLSAGFERVILFIHLRDELKGRDARGEDLVREAVTQVRIPTTGPSVFSEVIRTATVHFGPWPTDRVIDQAFAHAMGGIEGSVLVLPVRVRERVPVVVFASGPSTSVDRASLSQLVAGVQAALEQLIFRRKSASPR